MSDRPRLLLSTLAILAVALIVWLPTIGWGLPSREADKYLFGDRRPWTGAEIVALVATTQPTNAMRGADVDADPILDRSKPVILNDTDAKRAAIVRRYRLMSGQPDEFIQFKALSEMAARSGLAKLDPRLYQYGGLWMYPVGALVRTAMLVGYIPSPPPGTPAIEFYLDHPEAFGKLYVVARFYSWCWGIVAAFAIAWIARRVTESIGLATLASVAFMLLPVTRTATHEAKPHLAGAALCLCAIIAATRYVETGKRRWLIGAGALCGAAMAMVVSMLLSCAVLPTMVWLRHRATKHPTKPTAVRSDPETRDATSDPTAQRSAWSDRFRAIVAPLATSLAIAAIVYVTTNPFVLINAIAHPEILRSNLENSTAMYSTRSDGIHAVIDAIGVLLVGMGWGAIFAIVTAGAATLLRLRCRGAPSSTTMLLATVSVAISIGFILLAQGKSAEYARFGIVPVASLLVACASAFAMGTPRERGLLAIIPLGLSLLIAVDLIRRSTPGTPGDVEQSFLKNVLRINAARDRKPAELHVNWEPAPWSMPPCDLFSTDIVLSRLCSPFGPGRLVVFPTNLARQVGENAFLEHVDWRDNDIMILGESGE